MLVSHKWYVQILTLVDLLGVIAYNQSQNKFVLNPSFYNIGHNYSVLIDICESSPFGLGPRPDLDLMITNPLAKNS